MYSTKSGLILGFHGTDQTIIEKVINKKEELISASHEWDWLGHGLYFWEHNPERAFEFAQELKDNPERSSITVKTPDILGAVIDLGKCLDLTVNSNLVLLKKAYGIVRNSYEKDKKKLPANKNIIGNSDYLIRNLDCLVIETLHESIGKDEFDSVRAVFWEGDELYPRAGFKEKNHIQICIRNPNCIKGYFLPREPNNNYRPI